MMRERRRSCLVGLGISLLLASLFAAFLFLCASLIWDLRPQDLSSRQNAPVIPLILLLSTCAGLGGGVLAYALTREKTEE